ncbi:NADP-dependent oxidoreductase [Tranquillimonas alkanivorans]|uniref:NADPH:quinone reductase n=1 Tax=Tranquillimonas alkanivorans TaxID=441119 RepID=A0A1I5QT43_9RHOB|nr:NADP-dependent oxidoreductase [Tranquillimonas alkanivorans]SFP49425.1 NADPH:quinone reductase [Tranquillimonas alkanivorans]
MSTVIRIHEFGDASVLRAEDQPVPEPGPGELLVRVDAAGVNPVDFKIREGAYPLVTKDDLPFSMGADVAGTVERAGEGVTSFDRGAAIHAMLGQGRGAYAQHVIVKSDEAAAIPANLSAAEAASVPLAGLTAWQGLLDHGRLAAGQRVLIHGAAGGVGHFAVQIAKAQGATVIATAREEDADFLRDLGADEVIDYRNQRFEDETDEIDLVFDTIGGETQERSWQVLKKGGAMVSTLDEPSESKANEKNAHRARFLVQPNGTQLEEIDALIHQGKIRVVVDRTFPLDQAGRAHDTLEGEHIRGKIALTVG